MSTKQCACCDLFRDEYELDNVGGHTVCEDCIDSCPHDPTGQNPSGPFICNISGRAMKPDVEQAVVQFQISGGAGSLGAGGGFGTTGTHHIDGSICNYPSHGACSHPSHGAPSSGQIQSAHQAIQQMFGGGAPFAKQIPVIPEDAQCDKHGGHWGDDETCDKCTDDDGDPKPYRKPKVRKHLTNTQSAPIDSTLDRLRLQLKAGLDEEGRPLKDADRKDIERQIEIRTEPISEDEEVRLLLGYDDLDAEARRLFGME